MKKLRISFICSFICISILSSCVSLQESEIRSSFVSANLSIECNKYDEAIIPLSRILNIEPTNERALKLRGMCYYQLQQFHSALIDFTKLVDTYKYSEYLLLKAETEYELDLYNEVIIDSLEAEKLSTCELEKFSIWNLLANSYNMTNQFSNAENYYVKLLTVVNDPNIHLERAENLIQMKKHKEAKDILSENLVLFEKYSVEKNDLYLIDEYYFLLGYCELSLGNFSIALEAFEKIYKREKFENLDYYMSNCYNIVNKY